MHSTQAHAEQALRVSVAADETDLRVLFFTSIREAAVETTVEAFGVRGDNEAELTL